ncbi:AfsA-related hotdog domain-containing protein [Xenorhabdus bovienii]|uniref:A-factor biosynthesis hotdog domain-containing protein n=1 Tax=Xenorhabdus bovienii str. Intermedium TaxID=1379677 RepID=A0A077QCK0_XENBV|nr:AfsA-related hotdog domain-containing protein [Xenorhabdus bovienii]CDH30865.1 conserved hypothetical protein [Xenorhabdus bovienii str. Intermedium]
MIKSNMISPALLHKNSIDDVLIMNPRIVIPSKFVSETPNTQHKMVQKINSLYFRDSNNNNIFQFPPTISIATGIPFSSVMEKEENIGVPYQVLKNVLNEKPIKFTQEELIEDNEIIEIFLNHHKITKRTTSLTFINNANHYFFYRKPHEHVPGIMFLEAARQSIYYQLYTFSEHILGEVTVSLSELNAKFYSYGELMYPIEIVVDDLTEEYGRLPKKVTYLISFYQRGLLIAQIKTSAPIVPLEKFQVARNAFLLDKEHFSPLKNTPITALITSANRVQSIVSLREISTTSCITSSLEFGVVSDAMLTIIYDGKLCFHTPIYYLSMDEHGIKWSFEKLEFIQLEVLKEIIKRGFVVCKYEIRDNQYA